MSYRMLTPGSNRVATERLECGVLNETCRKREHTLDFEDLGLQNVKSLTNNF